MASAKDLKKKIRVVSNTKKITRTMELVATAKAKRAQDRVNATTPYTRALARILESLAAAGTVKHRLLETPAGAEEKALVFVVTANRGLCGGYNSNVLVLAEKTIRALAAEGKKVEVHMAGRKGVARFRFLKIEVAQTHLSLDQWATFADAEKVGESLIAGFLAGKYGRVVVVYTRYHSAGVQKPAVAQILPIEPPKAAAGAKRAETVEFIFEPDAGSILEAILPLSVKTAFYRIVLESVSGEQIARRVAMKTATDNAEDMIRQYTRTYNRTRQAGITQQINEIVSGANALE